MGVNNATVIIVLKEHQTDNSIFYVNQIHNPNDALSYETSFLDTIQYSETYNNRKRAIERAKELEDSNITSEGILIYDGFCSYTLGEIVSKLGARNVYSNNKR